MISFLETKINKSKGGVINIEFNTREVIKHFNKNNNYANAIIREINDEYKYEQLLLNKKDMIILDIGANIGLFSLYASDSASKIYAIEPSISHFKVLENLIKHTNNIIPFNIAININNEDAFLYSNDENTTMDSLINIYPKKSIVKCVDIYSFIKQNELTTIDLIKCDIEGSEILIFNEETVQKIKNIVKHLYIAVHSTPGKELSENISFLTNVFKKHNYNVHLYKTDGLLIFR